MINKDNCILLGTLVKPHGTKGMLQVKCSGLKAEDIRDKGLVFVEIDGLPVPFFIAEFQEKTPDTVILRLEGIDSESQAREFGGYPVYVMKDQVKRRRGKTEEMQSIRGYRVIDNKAGLVGEAIGILEVSNNPLLSVRGDTKEILVPVHESIILEVNDRDRIIRINAPEGLLDL